jgi:hypothetical protein
MRDPISELISRVNETKQEIMETVSMGTGVVNFETYQRLVGRFQGLQIALDLLDDIMTEDDEKEEQ